MNPRVEAVMLDWLLIHNWEGKIPRVILVLYKCNLQLLKKNRKINESKYLYGLLSVHKKEKKIKTELNKNEISKSNSKYD